MMSVCLSRENSGLTAAWFHLNKVAGSLTADGVDLAVDDGDDLRQRQTDCRQTGYTDRQTGTRKVNVNMELCVWT